MKPILTSVGSCWKTSEVKLRKLYLKSSNSLLSEFFATELFWYQVCEDRLLSLLQKANNYDDIDREEFGIELEESLGLTVEWIWMSDDLLSS